MKTNMNETNDLRSGLERLRGTLTWRPWVGEKYPAEGGILVVGESNYADETNDFVEYPKNVTPEKAVDKVNEDWNFTNKVIRCFCIDRAKTNRTFDGISGVLNDSPDSDERARAVWNSIAYMDLIQCALRGRWDSLGRTTRERPDEEMWKRGWSAVLAAIAVLKPEKMLFVGSGVATTCNEKFLPENVQAQVVNARKIGRLLFRTGWLRPRDSERIAFAAMPNPGGARGFSPVAWRKALKDFV